MKNRSILITGASSGLGKEMALRMAKQGFTVFAGVRKQADGELLKKEASGIRPLILDITSEQHINEAFVEIELQCGRQGLAALINNAGFSHFSPVEYSDEAEMRTLFEINFFAPFKLTQKFLPLLKRHYADSQSRSKVINIISWAAIMPGPWNAFYSASKAALLALSESQYYEFQKINVDSIAVLPGMMKTPFLDKSGKELDRGISLLPSQGKDIYGKYLEHIKKIADNAGNNPIVSDPRRIAKKIALIIKKKKPRFKYHLGTDTKVVNFIMRLPFKLRYRMNTSIFGLNK